MDSYIKSQYWKHWTAAGIITVALLIVFRLPHYYVGNLLAIEFAADSDTFVTASHIANSEKLQILRNNLYLDFGFIAAYSMLFFFSARILRDLLEFSALKRILMLCLLPGIFDVAENVLTLQLLHHFPDDFCCYNLLFWMVRIKWAFAIPGIILVIIIAGYQFFIGVDNLYCMLKKNKDT